LKNYFPLLTIVLLCSIQNFAQEFQLQKNIKIEAVGINKKKIPAENIKLDNSPKLDEKTIAKITKNNTTEPLKQFVLEQQPQDKEIVKKRYWMGEDVTNKKNTSTVSLGNLTTKSKRIKIEFRDFGLVDGDRIQIYLNDKTINDNVILGGNYFFVYINLENGYNQIDIKALNEGQYGPNTAAINVLDDYGNLLTSNHWNLSANEIATLVVSRD
jgi:hypothetical protein